GVGPRVPELAPGATIAGPRHGALYRPASAEPGPLSLHDALPISGAALPAPLELRADLGDRRDHGRPDRVHDVVTVPLHQGHHRGDRKSTRLNSSHVKISYAVFCLTKKTSCR